MTKAADIRSSEDTPLSPSILGGAALIANVCIGAGMLGLPSAGSGAWMFWSFFALLMTMGVLLLSGWMQLEAFQDHPYKVSFHTVTKDTLGSVAALVGNISVYFVGAILLYAYLSSLGGIAENLFQLNSKISTLIIALFFSAFVWCSTRAVERLSLIFIVFLLSSFLMGLNGLLNNFNPELVFHVPESSSPYVLALFPVALTAFGYHHSVATMRDHYRDESRAKLALLWGCLIAFIFYTIWLIVIYGNLPREKFAAINQAGGNIEVMLSAMENMLSKQEVSNALRIFSVSAILSSFVGVGLGVFDFLADFFGFKDTRTGRAKTWAVTFLPPLFLSLTLPFGFVTAIGYSGAVATIWACFIPALLVWKKRKTVKENRANLNRFKAPGGFLSIYVVIIFGALTALFHLLNMADLLPQYPPLH